MLLNKEFFCPFEFCKDEDRGKGGYYSWMALDITIIIKKLEDQFSM